MQIDWTISVGSIADVMGFVLASIVMVVGMSWRLKALEVDTSKLDGRLTKLTEVVTKIAVQDERIVQIERRVDKQEDTINELRHGHGYILDPHYPTQLKKREV